ncbi:MAG: hypothetical protein JSS09_04960, partial [Verrucomicrobia bacterium]|nr:hypothetical protein [Verrucomicrobiota bacterium]
IENETIHLSDYIIITNNNKDSATIHYAMQPQQIETTKKIIKTCFTKAILSSNEQELKENLALFRYLIAHATPWERGSAAIAEWMEQAVYQYKGYNACYGDRSNPTQYRLVDLDADVSFSIESYFNDYMENMHLTPIQTS